MYSKAIKCRSEAIERLNTRYRLGEITYDYYRRSVDAINREIIVLGGSSQPFIIEGSTTL